MHDLFLSLLTIQGVIIHSLQKQKLRHEKFSSLSHTANKSRNIDILIGEPASLPPLHGGRQGSSAIGKGALVTAERSH